jgi:hypothetical protein
VWFKQSWVENTEKVLGSGTRRTTCAILQQLNAVLQSAVQYKCERAPQIGQAWGESGFVRGRPHECQPTSLMDGRIDRKFPAAFALLHPDTLLFTSQYAAAGNQLNDTYVFAAV